MSSSSTALSTFSITNTNNDDSNSGSNGDRGLRGRGGRYDGLSSGQGRDCSCGGCGCQGGYTNLQVTCFKGKVEKLETLRSKGNMRTGSFLVFQKGLLQHVLLNFDQPNYIAYLLKVVRKTNGTN